MAQDKLVIISPHRKSIQNEFVSVFKQHYLETFKEIQVDWVDRWYRNDLRLF